MSWVFPLCLLITLGVIVDMQMPCELFKREVKMDRLVHDQARNQRKLLLFIVTPSPK
jgi:hypothetical protein